jgi:signal transduction histidine kinase
MVPGRFFPRLKIAFSLETWISTFLVVAFQVAAVIVLLFAPFLAIRWFQTPFLGFLWEPGFVISRAQSVGNLPWAGNELVSGDPGVLRQINGLPVHASGDIERLLNTLYVGDSIQATINFSVGTPTQVTLLLSAFPVIDQIVYFWLPYTLALIYLTSSVWVFYARRGDRAVRSFAVFTAAAAVVFAGLFDLSTTQWLVGVWLTALGFSAGGLISMGLLFPQETVFVQRLPWLRWLGYIIGGLLAVWGLLGARSVLSATLWPGAWQIQLIFMAASLLFFLLLMIFHWRTSLSPVAREQARLVLWGGFFSFAPLLGVLLFSSLVKFVYQPVWLFPLIIFPFFSGYAILRYRQPDVDLIFSRGITYLILSALIVGGYALLVAGLSLIFNTMIPADHPILVGGIVIVLALLLSPVRSRLQTFVNRLFFRSAPAYQDKQQAFTRTVSEAASAQTILAALRDVITENLAPGILHLFIYDYRSGQFSAVSDKNGQLTSELRFPANSPLVEWFTQRTRQPVFIRSGETMPVKLSADRARLALLDAILFVPLPGRSRLLGWMALGQRLSGEPYSRNELNFLESLSDQASLALERSQVVSDLERRVQEMDVLARIAQGINITLNFDDILELVYAQTNRLIPARDFAITLFDSAANVNYHAFFLQDDERLAELENRPIPDGLGLEQVILTNGQPLFTDNYERECRSYGKLPALQGVFAWIGVPLSSGAEVIGVFSLASRDPEVSYSTEQVQLLQAIADQTAGAIIKAGLLQESETRARQLASLNDVARVLGSTLDINLLLNRLLQSAVDILDCEAGTLFLVDELTAELIFTVTAGPVAENLVGSRLPPGTGLVGRAVTTRGPVVANDVLRNKDWFANPDEKTGFHTRSLLVFPMIVKDQVVGVIEVINKRSGMPFTNADQELLEAFAAQAAVAFENARLYTMTDQALAERVEELSVMQRIDRELNASLDVERAMRITLDWGMRQSRADSGLIAVLEESAGARVMAFSGYPPDQKFLSGYLPDNLPAVQRAVESGQPQRCTLLEAGADGIMLADGQVQIVVPIRRETQVIGLTLLESRQLGLGDEELQAFLTRLSDHAAIAISNAQLYSAVQSANQAKSDFISMVSHELKTPMTSIRGYAELLATGKVGTVSEAQANFLNTIQSNVERMQILVSDLADVARIEAGRLRLEYRAESMQDLIREAARAAQNQIDMKKQKLILEMPDEPLRVWGDHVRIIQVLTNLVSNAHKYSPEETLITIFAEKALNEWDPGGAPEVIHIQVKDTGCGINDADKKRIFQKFFRAEDQEVRNEPGTGLGLNITRHLVEIQGGKIWFESEFRKGTTFHFTIPMAEDI